MREVAIVAMLLVAVLAALALVEEVHDARSLDAVDMLTPEDE
jgi:hypothetical protein